MYYSTRFSKDLQPYEISHFVFIYLKAPIVEMGRNEDKSIFFEIAKEDFGTITFTASDYFIDCNVSKLSTARLTQCWQAFMSEKFGKEYVAHYNKYSKKNMEM